MMPCRRRRIACALFLLLLPPVATATTDVPEIRNGKEPLHGRRTIELQEQWRIGGLDDEENLLGVVRSAAMDDEGNVYLLDAQLVKVLVFDSAGRPLGELGRDGDGPGEFRTPSEVLLLPDGAVGVTQSVPPAIVKIARDGTPAGRIELGGEATDGGLSSLRKVMTAGDDLVYFRAGWTRDENRLTYRLQIARRDAAGRDAVVYFESTRERDLTSNRQDEARNFVPDVWTVAPDGPFWIAPERNEYRIDAYAADGTPLHTIRRLYESWQRTDEEIELMRIRMTPRRGRRQWEFGIAPTAQDIGGMYIAEDGRLWVRTSRGTHPQQDGIHSVWDVFDAEGRFDEQIALACEGTAPQDGLSFLGHGKVIVVRHALDAAMSARGLSSGTGTDAEAEPVEVIVYRMPQG